MARSSRDEAYQRAPNDLYNPLAATKGVGVKLRLKYFRKSLRKSKIKPCTIDQNSLFKHLFHIPDHFEVFLIRPIQPIMISQSTCSSNRFLPIFYVQKIVFKA